MKARIVLLVAALLLLLLSGVAPAQSGKLDGAPVYAVAQGWAAGGGYRLAAGTLRISGTASGPGYRLEGSGINQGAGCCCTYLPCLLRGVTP